MAVLNDYKNGISATGYGPASTVGPFTLIGGKYGLVIHDTGTPAATLQVQDPDGTFVNVAATIVTNGYTSFDLPPGTYQITTGTGTLLGVSLAPIPYRNATA